MRRFIAGFLPGVFALQQEATLPDPLAFALAGLAAALGCALLRGRWSRTMMVVCTGASLGYAYAAWRADIRLADALPVTAEATDLAVVGIVQSLPTVNERGVRFLFEVEQGEAPSLISLMWMRARDGEPFALPKAGERWAFTVRLRRPRGLANPHGFDFEGWALERGLRATGYIRAAPAPVRLAADVPGWPQTLHRWRGDVRERMQEALRDAPLAGVLVALAIGDQDAIDAVSWDVFWRTGVGHLMSISGLHITMLAALAAGLAAWLWVRIPGLALVWPARKAACVVGFFTALAYTLLTGYAVPAQRTLLMLATMAACVLLDRHGSPSRVLSLAALVVLLVDPWAVASPGLWLSFGAVAAILYAVSGRVGHGSRWQAMVREQAVVSIAMLPMLAALFQEISIVSPLANAIAIPLVSLVVVPLTLAGAFLGVPFLLLGAHALMVALMAPLERMAAWPFAMGELPAPSTGALVLSLAGCAWLLAPRGVPLRSFGVLLLGPLVLLPGPRPVEGAAWIDVLDVGNGLAIVVRTRFHALVFDAGPAWSGDTDSGERIVVPFLRGEGLRPLDMLMVSHADDDHAGGAISVAAMRQPATLLTALPAADAIHGLVDRSLPCAAGQSWTWDGVRFDVLHPPFARTGDVRRKENDWSCVLRVATAGGAALVTADAEARSEREMLARDRVALRADVLVVPHHGSRTSSTPAFIEAVAPRDAIFTVGYRNRFHHPNAQVLDRYVQRGIAVWRSDRDGAVRVTLPSQGARPSVERIVPAVRYWSDRRGVEE